MKGYLGEIRSLLEMCSPFLLYYYDRLFIRLANPLKDIKDKDHKFEGDVLNDL